MKKFWGVIIVLMCCLFITACGNKEVSEDQIKNDIAASTVNLYKGIEASLSDGGNVKVDELNSMSIKKRNTDEKNKTDIIYADLSFKSGDYSVNGGFVIKYTLYNDGWKLDNIGLDSKYDVAYEGNLTNEEITDMMGFKISGFDIEDVQSATDEKDGKPVVYVTGIETTKNGINSTANQKVKYTFSIVEPKENKESFTLKWKDSDELGDKEYVYNNKFTDSQDFLKQQISNHKVSLGSNNIVDISSADKIQSIKWEKETRSNETTVIFKNVEITLNFNYRNKDGQDTNIIKINELKFDYKDNQWVINTGLFGGDTLYSD